MPGALQGVTVLDLSGGIAGPYACMLMACMGARVIKVEPPGGSPERGDPRFSLWNRGKESVTLDLESAGGPSAVRALASRADVLVHDWLPSRAPGYGLDYEAVRAANPRIVYCTTAPYAGTGPEPERAGDHYSVAADMGMFGDQGGPDDPTFIYVPLVAYGTAFTLCLAASAALYVREVDGIGQKVEVPLQYGAMAMQSAQFVSGDRLRDRGSSLRQGIRVGIPVYRLYRARDGWFFLACGNNTFFNKLCILLEHPELTEDERFQDAPWGISPEHYDALSDILEPIFETNTVGDWIRLLSQNDIPCAPVQQRHQFAEHPQVAANRMIVPVEDPALGPTLQMGVPVWLHGAPGTVPGPAPRPGEHTEHVLGEIGEPRRFRRGH